MEPYRFALILAAGLSLLAVLRLISLGIARQLPFLVAFLSYASIQWLLILVFSPNSPTYAHLYFYTEPIAWVLSILMVREMYHTVFRLYPGISGLGKWVGYLAGLAAFIVGVVMILSKSGRQLTPRAIQGYTVFWEMGVFSTLALFIAFMIFLVWHYPIALDSNLLKNIAIFSVYFFLSAAVLQMFPSEMGRISYVRNFILTALQALCYASWAFLMKKPSASPVVTVGSRLDAAQSAELLEKLAAINNILARPGRR